jgi:hypothetical protein
MTYQTVKEESPMKKTLFVLVLLFSLVILGSCKDDEVTDYGVRIVFEDVSATDINVHAVIDEDVSTLALLSEVSLEVAAMTYQKHMETIGYESVTMTVYLYQSDTDFDDENVTYGHQIFTINLNATSPGISLGTNALKVD